jgi:hypothetical protein
LAILLLHTSSISLFLCLVEMGATTDCDDGPAIGIDLGTTYSCVAVWRPLHNRVEVIPNNLGNLTTPSCVAFTDTWRPIGEAAVNQAARNPVNTIFGKNRTSSVIASWLLIWCGVCINSGGLLFSCY